MRSPTKKEPGSNFLEPGIYLATTYSHKTFRLTTIGAAAFHFRVRNGTGWFHRALVTRGQSCLQDWVSGGLSLGLFKDLSDPPDWTDPTDIFLLARSLTSTRRTF
jgi:hypothetical protein